METTLYDSSGGDLSLNFLNTADWPAISPQEESLHTYADFLLWSFEAGSISAGELAELEVKAAAEPQAAEEALRAVRSVRKALHGIVTRLATKPDMRPQARDEELFNRALRRALAHRQLDLGPEVRWTFACAPLPLDYPLWAVLLAAADLLTSPELGRVHSCANHECGWTFVDRSRNGSRKWCSSTACGNRERVRQYYSRKR